jgi:hypothetical protein
VCKGKEGEEEERGGERRGEERSERGTGPAAPAASGTSTPHAACSAGSHSFSQLIALFIFQGVDLVLLFSPRTPTPLAAWSCTAGLRADPHIHSIIHLHHLHSVKP